MSTEVEDQKTAGNAESSEHASKWEKNSPFSVALIGAIALVIAPIITAAAYLLVASMADSNSSPASTSVNSTEPPPTSAPSKRQEHYAASFDESVVEGDTVWLANGLVQVYGEVKGSLGQSDCSGPVKVVFEPRDSGNRLMDGKGDPTCIKQRGLLKYGHVTFDASVHNVDIVVFVDGKEVKRVGCPRDEKCRW